MERIIIDTDPGTDDAFAIALAIKSSKFDILGITTVNGNCSLENGTNNAKYLVEMLNSSIPVYAGSENSLTLNNENATNVHGNNGMGGVKIPNVIKDNDNDVNAIDWLIQTVNNSPKEITVVAIGPLTNIAVAINRDKEFAKNIKKLVIMGGGKELGNITPWAEFNFYIDSVAANIVLNAGIDDVVIVPLNVTEKNILTNQRENKLLCIDNKIAKFLYDITRASSEFDRSQGFDGACIHDPVTIAYLIDKAVVKLYDVNMDVVVEGEKMGQCIFDESKVPNCKIALEIDDEKFFNMFFETVFK